MESLDDPCGEHFTYRDLVECGETWRRLAALGPVDNLPRAPETFAAMRALCAAVLDPVARRFGRLELTYAFASPLLARHVPGRIHPPLDQHAGHERTASGKLVCSRLGLAADLCVPGLDSRDLALFVVEHTGFDRLYVYGPDRPVHVSVGPERKREIVLLRAGPSGRRIPRVVTAEALRRR
jgi:hypothetical protein